LRRVLRGTDKKIIEGQNWWTQKSRKKKFIPDICHY